MTSVKWLGRILLLDAPFDGYQMRHSYRLRQEEDEVGEPLARMQVRALMVPPGIPEFRTRERTVTRGECVIEGGAWSGRPRCRASRSRPTGARPGRRRRLRRAVGGRWAWRGWRFSWNAEPGEYELCCRARDEAGNVQPLEPQWNVGGYANNAVQRVPVTVTA